MKFQESSSGLATRNLTCSLGSFPSSSAKDKESGEASETVPLTTSVIEDGAGEDICILVEDGVTSCAGMSPEQKGMS